MQSDYVGPLVSHNDVIRTELGTLMTQLSSSYSGQPLDANELDFVIQSPQHEQMVAMRSGHVVGAASVSVIPYSFDSQGIFSNQPCVWLGSVIVDKAHRGKEPGTDKSIATRLWEEVEAWCKSMDVPTLEFMTEEDRPAAIGYYTRQGAVRNRNAWLFNAFVDTTNTLDMLKLSDLAPSYETCKALADFHLLDAEAVLTKDQIDDQLEKAASAGLKLVQYIAPSGSPAHKSLLAAGLEPRREELIMRADFS